MSHFKIRTNKRRGKEGEMDRGKGMCTKGLFHLVRKISVQILMGLKMKITLEDFRLWQKLMKSPPSSLFGTNQEGQGICVVGGTGAEGASRGLQGLF
jgi:hypothetical protein